MATAVKSKIKRFKIDLTKAKEYVDGNHERIICYHLRINKLFSDEFLYSFFDFSNVDRVLSTASTRDTSNNVIYAFNKTQLHTPGKRPNCSVRDRLKEDIYAAIAIYDGRQLKPASIPDSDYGYEFLDPKNRKKALVGIAELLLNISFLNILNQR